MLLTRQNVKLSIEGRGNPERDIRLNREDIIEIALVTRGPYLRVGFGVDQLHIGSDAIIGIANTADENGSDIQLGADL